MLWGMILVAKLYTFSAIFTVILRLKQELKQCIIAHFNGLRYFHTNFLTFFFLQGEVVLYVEFMVLQIWGNCCVFFGNRC